MAESDSINYDVDAKCRNCRYFGRFQSQWALNRDKDKGYCKNPLIVNQDDSQKDGSLTRIDIDKLGDITHKDYDVALTVNENFGCVGFRAK